ncbi:hypothetical protein SRB5_49410 [Streptomyces sp. RB5]|uniref:Uncharacterized protein n=1 Tax=Streptomyces smaragdinus TaxID=2585196 RepID=A0A7K0CMR0_9ACTN|nr:acyl-CoA/acyl-ACP dehydrogenase [Streptomyces smaragdinus]MQY14765.1 hypothetical protein [Streptomyces smaragdinus]
MTTEPLAAAPVVDLGLGRRVRALARDDGPAAALTELRSALGPGWGPGGHTLLPRSAPDPAEADLLLTVTIDSGDLGVWHDSRRRGGDAGPWALGAAWIRVGLGERLLRLATAYVSGRKRGNEPLSSVSAVGVMIGSAAGDLAEANLLLEHDGEAGLPRAITAVADAQRTSLRMLGASGFLDEEPGRLGRAIDLLGDIFHTPEVGA